VTGCEFNPFREGAPASFYGVGPTFALDTSRKFTVVTQFITNSNSSAVALTSIRRFYIQDGRTLPNPLPGIAGITQTDEFTDKHCAEQKVAFGESNVFANLGGLATLGSAFQREMVLEMSIDEDRVDNMLWLDSTFPPGADPQKPGVRRGLCGTDTGVPADVENNNRSAQVVFSNIKFGPIGSTNAFEGTGIYASLQPKCMLTTLQQRWPNSTWATSVARARRSTAPRLYTFLQRWSAAINAAKALR
jgi:cellulose 1,4-beta-cellobiosidase